MLKLYKLSVGIKLYDLNYYLFSFPDDVKLLFFIHSKYNLK